MLASASRFHVRKLVPHLLDSKNELNMPKRKHRAHLLLTTVQLAKIQLTERNKSSSKKSNRIARTSNEFSKWFCIVPEHRIQLQHMHDAHDFIRTVILSC